MRVVAHTATLADISIAPAFAAFVPLPIQSDAHIPGWFKRVQTLPAWQATEPPKMA